MEKIVYIKNRNGIRLAIKLNIDEGRKKCVFLLHGLGARKDYPHMRVLENCFALAGYNVVNIDACNSNNESGKSEEGITFTGHYNDLVDAINWAKKRPFFSEPFALAGQSMGAVACVLYAENFANSVGELIIANCSWLDGKYESQHNRRREIILAEGQYEQVSVSTGKSFIIKKNYLDDLENYNLSKHANKITANTTLIVGKLDTPYHIENNKKLYGLLNCKKQIFMLEGVPHDLANTPETEKVFRECLNKILKIN